MSLVHRGPKQVILCRCRNRVIATLKMTGAIRCTRCGVTLSAERKRLPIKEATRER